MKISNFKSLQNISTLEDLIRFTSTDLNLFLSAINGGIDLLENCSTQLLSVSFIKANTTYPFSHSLGRIPSGYLVAKINSNSVIFDGNQQNTMNKVYLQASAVSSGKVLLF